MRFSKYKLFGCSFLLGLAVLFLLYNFPIFQYTIFADVGSSSRKSSGRVTNYDLTVLLETDLKRTPPLIAFLTILFSGCEPILILLEVLKNRYSPFTNNYYKRNNTDNNNNYNYSMPKIITINCGFYKKHRGILDIIVSRLTILSKLQVEHVTNGFFIKTDTIDRIWNFWILEIQVGENYWMIEGGPYNDQKSWAIKRPETLVKKPVHVDGHRLIFLVPRPSIDFKRSRTKLLHCNVQLAESIKFKYRSLYARRPNIGKNDLIGLTTVRDTLKELGAHLILCSGTLLGWYRNCGFIPYTSDVDTCILFDEFRIEMFHAIKNQRIFSQSVWMGKRDSPYLFKFYNRLSSNYLDLFVMYNETVQKNRFWLGAINKDEKFDLIWTYPPILELCSAVLEGELFSVPCNVEAMLEAEYGKNWSDPIAHENYVWDKSPHNGQKINNLNDQEMLELVKYY